MTDTDASQENKPRESVYSISGGTSKRTADSTDPIYQYSTVQGKTKTRKFAHPKTARAIDGPAGDHRKFSKSTSRTRAILLSACALVLLSVCVAIAVAIGGIGKRQSVQHVDGNERNLSHHQPSSNDVTSTPSLQEIHIITSERFQRQPESTPNVVTALNDRTMILDTTPEVPPQTAKLTDSGHLHEDVVSSASPYEDGNQHVSNMVTEVASKQNSQSVENTVTVNIPLTQKPSAASRQNRLTDITTVYSGSDDIMSKPLAASQSSETASDLKLGKTLGQPNNSNLPNTEAPTPTSAEISTLPPFEPNSRSYQLDVTQAGIKKANELNNLQDTLPFYCDFQNTTLCGFTQDYLDDFDWSRNSGGTSSSNTGPSYDHTQNDLTGYYMYIETSNYNLGDMARLISPEFLIENHLCLRFWYHMYGTDIGELNVYQKRSSNLGNAIWSKGLAMGNAWHYANVTLANSGIAMAYQVVFEGVHGGSYQGDIALDDVLIQDGSCDDIYSSAGIEPFRTNMTVDLASQVELVCKLRRSGNPHMDGISWTRISGYNVDVVAHGLNVLVSGYSVAWNASSQHYTLRIHSVRYIDDAEWRCRFDAVDLEESVWLQVRHTLPFYCDFQNTTICGFTQDSGDDFDWLRNSGETPSYDTGPSYDHTENDFTGYYMYIETSSHGLGYSARLISPAFDIENHLCLRFWYHMYGADIGELNVYRKRSSYLGNAIWSKGLDMGNAWHYANVTLANSGIAMAYQVVFEGVHGGAYRGDIAIDDVLIQDGSCDDIYTSAGIEPFPTNLTVDYASQVELICRVRGVGHPQMDIVSWTRISGDTVVVAVRGLNVLDTGDDPEEPGEQNRYSVAWNASSQYYTLRIHSVRNIDEAEWLCRFDTVDLEESVWLQVRDPVCQWQCLNGGVCRHTWNGSSICFCSWPYSGDDCSIGTTGSLDVLCDFGDALICGVTYEADDYTEFVWANILNFDFSPIVDHTYGNVSAYFGVVHTVYVYRYYSMTRLFTPVYTASSLSANIVCLEFWYNHVYHLSGTHVDVFLRQSGVANDTIINSFDFDYLETGWRQSSVPITIEAQFFQMIIELSFAYREMILIDDLIVHDGTCKDIDGCSVGEFYCEDNTTCVSADYACDGNMNCPDRSDERGCGDCGGEFYVPAGGSRKIQSPGSTYGLYNVNCSWLITTDDDFSFKVVFDQWSDRIQYGSLDIGSGSQVSNHGRQLRFRDRILGEPEFLVNSNELWLHLRVDILYSYNVWQIMLLSQPESPLPLPGELCTFEDVYICGFILGNSGEMWARQRGQVSQRQPWYDHTSQNGYYMYVDGDYYYGTGVRLTSITQPPSRESCLEFWYYMSSSSDHLRVFINSGGNNDTLIVRLTGNIEPFWRYARIAYSMDEPHQVIFEGESYYWSSNIAIDDVRMSNTPCNVPHCGGNITLQSNPATLFLTSPNYPDNYDEVDNCLWYIGSTVPGHYIINFWAFDTFYNHFLEFGVGRDAHNVTSRQVRVTGSQLPNDFRLNSNEMWMNWMASTGNGTGWNVTVSHVPLCLHNITLKKNESLEIQSSNYPSEYNNLEHCTWLLSAEEGFAVNVRFLDFSSQWNHDYISLGLGRMPSNDSRVIFHSGSQLPEDWESTSREIWITFETDYSQTYSGFKLEVQSIKYCENIGLPMCERYMPYGGFLFYSPLGLTRQQAEQKLEKAGPMVGCHEYVDLFLCSLLAPECGADGYYREPCREFCDNVTQACNEITNPNGYDLPVNCSTLPTEEESFDCVRLTPCLSQPCQNNGTCSPRGDDDYQCNCVGGYVGKNCEIDFDECGSSPCLNGGTCIDRLNGFVCRCAIGFAGTLCGCVDLTIEICRDVQLNYARLQEFSPSGSSTRSRVPISVLETERSTRASAGCYEHIGFFMCTLFAPECTDEGYYRPPCEDFCNVARQHCEPKFAIGGIDWVIDCDLLPNSNDSNVCTLDPDVAAGSGICGTRNYGSNRIVNGWDAELGAWPWQVSLLLNNDHNCGGTVIRPNWILTAAHCVESYSAYQLDIKVGFVSHIQGSDYLQVRPVAQFYMHPLYNGETRNGWDAALLRIEEPLSYTDYVRPACLPPANDLSFFKDGDVCTISGWGKLYEYASDTPDHLQEAEVTIVNHQYCSELHGQDIDESNMCVWMENEYLGACYGDSGGPLICRKANGRWYLAGITSYKRGNCGSSAYPDVFTRTTSVVDWIEATISQAENGRQSDQFGVEGGEYQKDE